MDEVFTRRKLIDGADLRALSVRSDLRGAIQLGGHLGLIVLSGLALWAALGTWWAVPIFLVHGVLINFLYAGQHELSHWTVFKTRRINDVVGRAFGFVLFYPRDFDQIQHQAHHRYTQDWGQDGELARPRYDLGSYLLWLLGPTYWYSRFARIVRFARGIVREPYLPGVRHAELIREARWHLAGYAAIAIASVATGSWFAVTYWLAPMLVTKVVHQLQNTIEHLGLPHVGDVTRNTRTTRTNAVMRFLCWNMQYHTAHHSFPGVPCYRLPALHRRIFDANGQRPPSMTYLGFQRAVIRAFARGRTEADYPDDRVWIADDTDLAPVAPRIRA